MTDTDAGSKAGRSPSYPGIDLKKATTLAAAAIEKVGRNGGPATVLEDALGFKSSSGASRRAIAALQQYGLLERSGRGKEARFSFSSVAREFLRNPEADRPALQRRMALRPKVFAELHDEFGADESRKNAAVFHLTERNFSAAGAAEAVEIFFRNARLVDLPDHPLQPFEGAEPGSEDAGAMTPIARRAPQASQPNHRTTSVVGTPSAPGAAPSDQVLSFPFDSSSVRAVLPPEADQLESAEFLHAMLSAWIERTRHRRERAAQRAEDDEVDTA